eukprot:gnl/MRDRNA2_/MRDRNA2_41810_c0_seq1.p1 gnl/MRDRNA2_/MRDRNA2_41810_c0~~gnl/MRDRNA2_/MRDRNA2_41810_c0_seq1.p1  ORF type:complete len:426 (-),score=71.81 gnl/MRDRNA2_/MRDRNA2_41810_c0_seq1:341-1618(-)
MDHDARWPPEIAASNTSINHLERSSGYDVTEYLKGHLGPEKFSQLQHFYEATCADFNTGVIDGVQPDMVTCLRYMVGEKWNMDQATKRLRATIKHRKAFGADYLLTNPPDAALLEHYSRARVCLSVGHDKEGKLLIYDRLGALFESGCVEAFSPEEWWLLYSMQFERWLQEMSWLSTKFKRPVWRYTIISDAAGTNMSVLNHMQLLKYINDLSSDHYPEFINRVVVINAPSIFVIIWRVICTIMDPQTTEKFELYSDVPVARLLELIDRKHLPLHLGGDNRIPIRPQWRFEDLPLRSSLSIQGVQKSSSESDGNSSTVAANNSHRGMSFMDTRPIIVSAFACLLISLVAPSFTLATTVAVMGMLSTVVLNRATRVPPAACGLQLLEDEAATMYAEGQGASRQTPSDKDPKLHAGEDEPFSCCCWR